jgi:hypothetical protein
MLMSIPDVTWVNSITTSNSIKLLLALACTR